MNMVYPIDTSCCALCERRIQSSQHVGMYMVGAHAAIGYALCKLCGQQARRGIPPDQLRKLDQKLEAEAVRLGITNSH